MEIINILGGNLKKIREKAGFTQSQIADYIKIGRSAYSNYEAGLREVPIDVLERVAKLFGCEPSVLFEENIQTDDIMFATAFRISNLSPADMEEIGSFKDIVLSYLKMERIRLNETE